MTDTIDAALGATTGLLALGVTAAVASKLIGKPKELKVKRPAKKSSKKIW